MARERKKQIGRQKREEMNGKGARRRREKTKNEANVARKGRMEEGRIDEKHTEVGRTEKEGAERKKKWAKSSEEKQQRCKTKRSALHKKKKQKYVDTKSYAQFECEYK